MVRIYERAVQSIPSAIEDQLAIADTAPLTVWFPTYVEGKDSVLKPLKERISFLQRRRSSNFTVQIIHYGHWPPAHANKVLLALSHVHRLECYFLSFTPSSRNEQVQPEDLKSQKYLFSCLLNRKHVPVFFLI